jgi:hypothetical protein
MDSKLVQIINIVHSEFTVKERGCGNLLHLAGLIKEDPL